MSITERLKAEAAVETCDLNHKFLFLPDHPRNHLNHKYCVYCTAQWFPALRERWKQMEEGNARCELGHAFVAMQDHPKDKISGELICPHCTSIAYEQIAREAEAMEERLQANGLRLAELQSKVFGITVKDQH